jgi:hypothetical protein
MSACIEIAFERAALVYGIRPTTIIGTLADELTLEPETSYCMTMWGLGLDRCGADCG